jgi:hypothetical protein
VECRKFGSDANSSALLSIRVQYPAKGAISIWIGTFKAENEMDRCTDSSIEPSLNLPQPLSSICEVAYEPDPISIRTLLEGFSGWETFVDEACEVAALNGVEKANGVLVCYYLLCDAPPSRWPGILYLGTFQGQDVS